jgi:hypothetical protein
LFYICLNLAKLPMKTAYFQELPEHICRHLSEAKTRICAAVCWFSHKDIFSVLLERLQAGIQVELLLEYDSQNIRDDGLDFQHFVRAGGELWASRAGGLMHHKFALVDTDCLLTGSFNWTYNSNAENLLVTNDSNAFSAFQAEFSRQKSAAQRIFQVRRADVKVFAAFPLFEKTQFPLAELRKKVSLGGNVWLVRLDKLKVDQAIIFSEQQIPFDTANILAPFWTAYRMWDEKLFDEEMERLKTEYPNPALGKVRCWARRMKIGDVIFATEKSRPQGCHQLIAVGIIQFSPQPFLGEGFSSFLSVQWIKIMKEMPHVLPGKASGQLVLRYKGSALRVLQEVFGS